MRLCIAGLYHTLSGAVANRQQQHQQYITLQQQQITTLQQHNNSLQQQVENLTLAFAQSQLQFANLHVQELTEQVASLEQEVNILTCDILALEAKFQRVLEREEETRRIPTPPPSRVPEGTSVPW